ncbi:MAG TPA: Asp-tRNA(Asn)/Glu-tRNA(Gln) amidotransferase subunit GatC [Vicinamibacterales bacterium]|nr:Asp-tRNA(Asn)/Glu-tRNA(Gln) amidotransferase subunit GatC [Vicinamibacterales bacterium]
MPSQLTNEEVARIAELARLELTPGEAEMFAPQLTAILDYAARVQEVQTTDLTAPADGRETAPVWREDAVTPGLSRDEVLDSAPEAAKSAGLFRVPKVL